MMWIRGVLGARWFPFVAIGAVAVTVGAFGWGYIKGYDTAEDTYMREMAKALEKQYKRIVAQKELEEKLALQALEARYELRRKVNEIAEPSSSCELPADCLRWYDDVLRATTPDIEEPD